MKDVFRPTSQPARTIYDALTTEAENRHATTHQAWIKAERKTVMDAANGYVAKHGGKFVTMADVIAAETQACGHCDYAAKFAYGVAQVVTAAGQE